MVADQLNTNIEGMIVSLVVFFSFAPVLARILFRPVLVTPNLSKFFGFRGRINSVLHQRGHGLRIRNGLGRDILRQRIRHEWRWNGRDLHKRNPQIESRAFVAYT